MFDRELNSLSCLLGSKQNSPLWAAQTYSLSEVCHNSDSFQKLHLPYIFTFFAAWFTFKRDYKSLHLLRLWSFYSQNHRQSQTKFPSPCHAGYSLLLPLPITISSMEGLCGVMHPAGAFHIQRPDAEFFIQIKFSLILVPMTFLAFLGLCPSSHEWEPQNWRPACGVSRKISKGNVLCHKSLLLTQSALANEKTFVYDTNAVRKDCHF